MQLKRNGSGKADFKEIKVINLKYYFLAANKNIR